jgi:hypothetical protein
MLCRLHPLHRHDLLLLALIGVSLLLLGGQLFQLAEETQTPAGWRRIDLATLRARIDAGELSRQPAIWVRPAERGRAP